MYGDCLFFLTYNHLLMFNIVEFNKTYV